MNWVSLKIKPNQYDLGFSDRTRIAKQKDNIRYGSPIKKAWQSEKTTESANPHSPTNKKSNMNQTPFGCQEKEGKWKEKGGCHTP